MDAEQLVDRLEKRLDCVVEGLDDMGVPSEQLVLSPCSAELALRARADGRASGRDAGPRHRHQPRCGVGRLVQQRGRVGGAGQRRAEAERERLAELRTIGCRRRARRSGAITAAASGP